MTTNIEQESKFYNPILTSEKSDLSRLFGENRLRALAKSIPSHSHHQPVTATQSCISATIHATQEYLSQLIAGLSLTDPTLARCYVVSSSGLDAISWIERTEKTQHGWIPNYPVKGYITQGLLKIPPTFGMSPSEPAITLAVNRNDDNGSDFHISFSISDAEEIRILSQILNDAGEVWDEFEMMFAITPFTSHPLPDDVKEELDCREYLSAYIERIIDNADTANYGESFELEFSVNNTTNLHEPLVAAIAVFNIFLNYVSATSDKEKAQASEMAQDELITAINTGLIYKYWKEKS